VRAQGLGCRDLAGFNFASSEVSRALLDQLRGCAFLEDPRNVVRLAALAQA
jgi:hypothetical protein